jgi:hypothetical protein
VLVLIAMFVLSKSVKFVNRAIRVDGRNVSGLTDPIRRGFFANYNYEQAKLDRTPMPSEKRTVRGSMRTGRGADCAVTQSVNLSIRCKLPPKAFYDKACMLSHAATLPNLKDRAKIKSLFARRIPYLRYFWHAMKVEGLTPVATQVPVAHNVVRIGTLLDVLCIDEDGYYVVVELKTGFDNYYTKSNGRMRYPFEAQTNCPKNQHQLQIIGSHIMFKHTYPTLNTRPPIIIRCHSEEYDILRLHKWAADKADAMFAELKKLVG